MNVIDILNLMGTLSIGNSNITPSEQAIFLTYLNLANLELYRATANFNQDLLVSETFDPDPEDLNYELANIPFLVNSVYLPDTKVRLERLSQADLIRKDPNLSKTGQPLNYVVQGKTISLYPPQEIPVKAVVWYVPSPIPFDINTPESFIPYPSVFHPVLADGGLYYVFQDAGGFKNSEREADAKARWNRGKSELLSYLYNVSGESFSTFRNV